jgi:hypothetical protein
MNSKAFQTSPSRSPLGSNESPAKCASHVF